MIFFATIVIIVGFIYFQQRIYERHTKRFEKKTRKRYDKVLDELRKENKLKGVLDKTKWWNDFKSENILEVPISLISLFVLALLAAEIPPDLIDMRGRISILAMGYANSSIVNGLITKFKR